jgi:hypothetical protein
MKGPLREASIGTYAIPPLKVAIKKASNPLSYSISHPLGGYSHLSGVKGLDIQRLANSGINGDVNNSVSIARTGFIDYYIDVRLRIDYGLYLRHYCV